MFHLNKVRENPFYSNWQVNESGKKEIHRIKCQFFIFTLTSTTIQWNPLNLNTMQYIEQWLSKCCVLRIGFIDTLAMTNDFYVKWLDFVCNGFCIRKCCAIREKNEIQRDTTQFNAIISMHDMNPFYAHSHLQIYILIITYRKLCYSVRQ